MKSEIEALKTALIILGIIIVIIPLIFWVRKFAIVFQVLRRLLEMLNNSRPSDTDIPMTIIEQPPTVEPVNDDDVITEETAFPEITSPAPANPPALPSAPDAIG